MSLTYIPPLPLETKTHCPGRASCRDALAFYLYDQMLFVALISFTFAMLLFGVASGAVYCLQENALVVVILDDIERNRKGSDISVEMVEKVLDGKKKDTFAFALTEEQRKREAEAAIKLQAILRGHLARKAEAERRKQEETSEQKPPLLEAPTPPAPTPSTATSV